MLWRDQLVKIHCCCCLASQLYWRFIQSEWPLTVKPHDAIGQLNTTDPRGSATCQHDDTWWHIGRDASASTAFTTIIPPLSCSRVRRWAEEQRRRSCRGGRRAESREVARNEDGQFFFQGDFGTRGGFLRVAFRGTWVLERYHESRDTFLSALQSHCPACRCPLLTEVWNHLFASWFPRSKQHWQSKANHS